MFRRFIPILFAGLIALFIALPGQSAPGPKESDKPLPPATAAHPVDQQSETDWLGDA